MKSSLCILACVLQVAVLQQEINSCSMKQCPGRQTCIEEVKGCPDNNLNCGVRWVETSCVLMETNRSPSSCDDIMCAQNSICIVLQTANGTKAECKDVPISCKEIECDDGMQCVQRAKPRCVPIRLEVRPSDCSQLECPEDLVCMLLDGNRGARCAKPPVPTSCEELDCPPDLYCKMMRGIRRARCVQEETVKLPSNQPKISISRDCNELGCEDGYECKLTINRKVNGNILFPVATCMPIECPIRMKPRPPVNCSEVECRDDEVCMVCGEGLNTRARCMQMDNDTRRDTVIKSDDSSDVIKNRRPPMTCNELICGSLEVERCQEINLDNGRKRIAVCISNDAPKNCDAAQCDNETETCLELESNKMKKALCIPTRVGTSTPPTTVSGGLTSQPVNTNRPRIRDNIQILTPAERCEQLNCGRDSECLQVMKYGRRRAMCMKLRKDDTCQLPSDNGEEEMTVSNSILRLKLPDTCLERRCCDGDTCIIRMTADNSSLLAVCTPMNSDRDQLAKAQPLTCEELMCEEGSNCIMRQGKGGRRGGAICKRSRIANDPNASRPDDERRRSGDRWRPSTVSGGRRNSSN